MKGQAFSVVICTFNGAARIEPELTAKVLRDKEVRLYEVPISYFGRTYAEGKKITWRDGLGAVRALIRFRLER